MKKLIEIALGYQHVTVTENQRALVLNKGQFADILRPGEHRLWRRDTSIVMFDLSEARFKSVYEDALLRNCPDFVNEHLTVFRTDSNEVGVVLRDGRAYTVVPPDRRVAYWTDAGDWSVERLDISGSYELDGELARRLMRSDLSKFMTVYEVGDGRVGILSVDGVKERVLAPGTYWFWMFGRKHAVKMIDTRQQSHEVTGQEILTKDRVTLRVNISADYKVVDPERAMDKVKDFVEALHLALQLAFRKTLGALTLDQLLADKVSVDAEAAEAVRAEMAGIGIEVGTIALKDVVLPGEMREILNGVVAAQKEAEANVIRRREETNATRSLLNTAKLMEQNPLMQRLRELEALENIAGKVERLTIHNGTQGLMSDLVKLRD